MVCIDLCIEMSLGWRTVRTFYRPKEIPGSNFTTFPHYRLFD